MLDCVIAVEIDVKESSVCIVIDLMLRVKSLKLNFLLYNK